MPHYTPYEEQTQCCWSDDCDNVADRRVLVGIIFQNVCCEHKEELEEWVADQMA